MKVDKETLRRMVEENAGVNAALDAIEKSFASLDPMVEEMYDRRVRESLAKGETPNPISVETLFACCAHMKLMSKVCSLHSATKKNAVEILHVIATMAHAFASAIEMRETDDAAAERMADKTVKDVMEDRVSATEKSKFGGVLEAILMRESQKVMKN